MRKIIKMKDLKNLLKQHTPKEIIYMYTMWKIDLNQVQLQYLIDLKGE